MHVVIVDLNEDTLDKAVESIKAVDGVGEVWGLKVDVSRIDEVVAMREKVFDEFGEVSTIFSCMTCYMKRLTSGPCPNGQCWYRKNNPSHVHYDPPCRTTVELGSCAPNESIRSNKYRTSFRTIYGPAGEP